MMLRQSRASLSARVPGHSWRRGIWAEGSCPRTPGLERRSRPSRILRWRGGRLMIRPPDLGLPARRSALAAMDLEMPVHRQATACGLRSIETARAGEGGRSPAAARSRTGARVRFLDHHFFPLSKKRALSCSMTFSSAALEGRRFRETAGSVWPSISRRQVEQDLDGPPIGLWPIG